MEVWKFTIDRGLVDQCVHMPAGAVIISVQRQHGEVGIWAIVHPEEEDFEVFRFRIVVTGLDDPALDDPKWRYRATCVWEQDRYVCHVFEEV